MDFFKKRWLVVAAFLAVLGLCAAAVFFNKKGYDVYHILWTSFYSSHYFSFDVPDITEYVKARLLVISAVYLKSYLLPAFLMLFPAVLIAAYGLKKAFVKDRDPLEALQKPEILKYIPIALFILGLVLSIVVHFTVTLNFPTVDDEFSYLFQADIMAAGKLYVEGPPSPEHFRFSHIYVGKKWHSKYTIGWPLILAPFKAAGMPFLPNAFFYGGTLVLLFFLGMEVWNEKAALVAVFIILFSPFVILLSATYYPHVPTGFFMLLMLYCIYKIPEEPKWKYPAILALSLVMLLNMRPADGGIIFLGMIPLAIFECWKLKKSERKQPAIRMAVSFTAGFVIALGILGAVNNVQNDSPFVFSYSKYFAQEKWGFGGLGHGPVKGIWNFSYSYMRMGYWVAPFLTLGTALSLFRKNTRSNLLLIPIAGFVTFFFFYYAVGGFEFGARFYYPAFILMVLCAAGGISGVENILKDRIFLPVNFLPAAYMIVIAVFMSLGMYPALVGRVRTSFAEHKRMVEWVKDPPGTPGKSLTFLANSPDKIVSQYTRNHWRYNKQDNITVIFLDPAENRRLMEQFPNRKPYLVVFDYTGSVFRIQPYPQNAASQPVYYLFAGANYKISLFNPEKAEKAYKTALKMQPSNRGIQFNLAYLYFETGQYEKGIESFKKMIREHPGYANAYYYLGRCLGETGRRKQGIGRLIRFIKMAPNSPRAERAKGWVLRYARPDNKQYR